MAPPKPIHSKAFLSFSLLLVLGASSFAAETNTAQKSTPSAASVAPTITTQPTSLTTEAYAKATFQVAATGDAPLTYQWRRNGTNISAATQATFTTNALTIADNGAKFSVVVTSQSGSITSSDATLTVTPVVSVSPQQGIASVNRPVRFFVSPDGGIQTTATGTVTLKVDGTTRGTAPLVNGIATFNFPSGLPLGDRIVTASYSGDSTYLAANNDRDPLTYSIIPTSVSPLRVPPDGIPPGVYPASYPVPASNAYFVATDGANSNPGTIDRPWKTLSYAATKVGSGDTIVVRGGLYRDGNVIINPGDVKIQPYLDEQVTLKGSVLLSNWTKSGNYWYTAWTYKVPQDDGQGCTSIGLPKTCDLDPDYPEAERGEITLVDNTAIRQALALTDFAKNPTQRRFFVDDAAQRLYISFDPAGHTIESSALANGVVFGGSGTSALQGLTLSGYYVTAVQVYGSDVTIQNNRLEWNQVGISACCQSTSGLLFSHNTVSNSANGGVYPSAISDSKIVANVIEGSNFRRYSDSWNTGGMKSILSQNLLFQGNLVRNNFGWGFWTDIFARNDAFIDNEFYGNKRAAIELEISYDMVVAGNFIHDNPGGGLDIYSSAYSRIYNNTFYNNGYVQIGFTAQAREYDIAHENIANNLVVPNGSALGSVVQMYRAEEVSCNKATQSELIDRFDYNGYYRANLASPQTLFYTPLLAGKSDACGAKNDWPSVSDVQTNLGFEQHGLEVAPQSGDPIFNDIARGDYSLRNGSPAIGVGTPLPADIAASLGWQTGVPVDLGARQTGTNALRLPPKPESIYNDATPDIPSATDGAAYELGLKFQAAVDGSIAAVRFYKASGETLTRHTGRIWSAEGRMLASVTFRNETGSGWQQANFNTPLDITAGTTYVVTVDTLDYFPITLNALTAPRVIGNLTAIADGANGVFAARGKFPTLSYQNSNYFRDIVFIAK